MTKKIHFPGLEKKTKNVEINLPHEAWDLCEKKQKKKKKL